MRSPRDLVSLACRHGLALAGRASGATERRLAARRGRAVILTYHRVLPDGTDVSGVEPGMYVRASTFARQLDWIASRFPTRTLGQLLREPPDPDGDPVAVITFDDGWRDNLTVAWPLLRARNIPATLFVVSESVAAGGNGVGEFVRPHELRALSDEGMEIGAHTATHPSLDRVDRATAEAELGASKAAVEAWTGRPCEVFAYPYGAHGPAAVEVARSMFRGSVLNRGGWWSRGCDPALLPRVGIHQDMTSTRSLFEAILAD
jgi:peptidoglycan/xylan/chitin deacetylase (PgdA/CDA1 family)